MSKGVEQTTEQSVEAKMNHNYVQNLVSGQRFDKQIKDNLHKRPDNRLQRKIGSQVKNAKPTMAIYRPPSVRVSGDFTSLKLSGGSSGCASPTDSCNSSVSDDSASNQKMEKSKSSTHVHFGKQNLTHPPGIINAEAKSSGNLKRSKSFGATDQVYMAALSFDKDNMTFENNKFVRKACEDPNKMSCRQLMEVVRIVCNRAVDNCRNAEPAAQLCISIIEKERGTTFAESLLNSCREWFNEKDKLLRGPLSVAGVGGPAHRWISYVLFLSQLYQSLKDRECKKTHQGAKTKVLCVTLNMLLFECFDIIMKPPSIHHTEEAESMHWILSKSGRLLDSESPQRMKCLVMSMREAFVNPSITLNATVRKLLLELVELHASRWQFDMPQSVYYFPYTSK